MKLLLCFGGGVAALQLQSSYFFHFYFYLGFFVVFFQVLIFISSRERNLSYREKDTNF